MSTSPQIYKVTVVIPLYNEAENIESISLSVLRALKADGRSPHLLLIDDGSTDNSSEIVARLSAGYPEISYIRFSRNFGKEAAIMAGLQEADDGFDALAYMDSDGQHSCEDLLRLIHRLEKSGADLVCGARSDREYQSFLQRWLANQFYDIFHALTNQHIEEGVGDFNVLRPQVVKALRELREEFPFMKGLVAWVGFRREVVPVAVRPRKGGRAKSSTRKMVRLAVGALMSFSSWPLRTWSILGIISALFAFSYLILVVMQTAIYGREVPGYATIVILLLGLGGLQLLSVGVLGEYVARIYDSSKNRPRYIIADRSGRRSR